ncbi:TadE/TadG family type IV pilus assembly protein [Actinoalloteichus fjordicus]|uniref:TadE/TadG family type IV pilus assembly protein n=1 Tax=Actinoalloteichus fjordicus TaxID=1612552 RepID=UPI001E2BBA53|nr:TadE/TadG family type IV pilus assembly protein [Actinoalloteichus fjordicus]
MSGESGAVSVELVIATPLLLLVLLLIVQFTLWSHATHLAQAAASRGLAAARIHEATAAEGHHAASSLLDSLGTATLTEISIDVDRDTDLASARITGRATSVVPGLHLPVRAAASGPVERVVPAVPGARNGGASR